MIQQKIENGEGMLKFKRHGLVTAKLADEKTDPKKNPVDWEDWQTDPIIWKPIKNDYKTVLKEGLIKEELSEKELNNPDNYDLVLLTELEKLDIAKEKKKKDIALQLTQLYPEKVIDGTIKTLNDEKNAEIDLLKKIKDVKAYAI